MEKIPRMIQQIETIEDFIKVSYPDGKIDEQMANELLRLLREVKDTGLKDANEHASEEKNVFYWLHGCAKK